MSKLSPARSINVGALLVAAAGILIIFASAPGLFPPIPPGPIILAVAAGIIAFVPGRWTLVIGMLVPLFIIIGGLASGGLADNLSENAGAIAGTAIQVPALITATTAGTLAMVSDRSSPPSAAQDAR